MKGLLGFDEPQNQAALAVRRTAPFAGFVFALIVLWYAAELQAGRVATWLVRPWERRKAAPSFADVLATLRQAGLLHAAAWPLSRRLLTPPCPARRPHNPALRRHPTRCLRA